MPIDVICHHCQKTLRVGDHVAGKKIRCPACQGIVLVAAAEPARPEPPIEDQKRRPQSDRSSRRSAKVNRETALTSEEAPWDQLDSYNDESISQAKRSARTSKSPKSGPESESSRLIRRQTIESMIALAIAVLWCAFLGLGVFLLLDKSDFDDMEQFEKAQQAGQFSLILSGTLIVAILVQFPKVVPLKYLSMILVGVVTSLLLLVVASGDWVMIVPVIGCGVSIQRTKSVAQLLQAK